MNDKSPSAQIDDIITQYGGWKGATIKRLRSIILAADSSLQEEIKWRMKARPEGLPVWVSNGIVCYIETWKDNLKLIFFNGAKLNDSGKLFNARLESSSIRAIEIHENDSINVNGIKELVKQAVKYNENK